MTLIRTTQVLIFDVFFGKGLHLNDVEYTPVGNSVNSRQCRGITTNPYLYYLIGHSFQGAKRFFVLSLENVADSTVHSVLVEIDRTWTILKCFTFGQKN